MQYRRTVSTSRLRVIHHWSYQVDLIWTPHLCLSALPILWNSERSSDYRVMRRSDKWCFESESNLLQRARQRHFTGPKPMLRWGRREQTTISRIRNSSESIGSQSLRPSEEPSCLSGRRGDHSSRTITSIPTTMQRRRRPKTRCDSRWPISIHEDLILRSLFVTCPFDLCRRKLH